MEPLFEEGGALRFHAEKASVQALAATSTWPPRICAAGYARALRGWQPDNAGKAFNPVPELQEMDGDRFGHVTFLRDDLVAADVSSEGKVSIFDTAAPSWSRTQTVQAGGKVECLRAAGEFIAIGRDDGKVRVWRRLPADRLFQPLFSKDLDVDQLPITQMHLEEVNEGKEVLLAVYSSGKASVGVWRLTDGKLLHVWGTNNNSTDGTSMSSMSCVLSTLRGGVLGLVFWAEGRTPEVHLMHIISGEGGRVPPDGRLASTARPLSASFDGATLAVGFENGAVSVFGKKGWQRWHRGAVGCVQAIAAKSQVLSGAADATVCLWSLEGIKLAQVKMEEAVSVLTAGPLYATAGLIRGDVQILVMSADGQDQPSPPKSDDGTTAPDLKTVVQYDPFFDSRWKDGGVASRASQNHEEYRRFVPLQALHLPDPEALKAMSLKPMAETPATTPVDQPTSDNASKFDMSAAIKGAESEEPSELPKKEIPKDARGIGEDAGVARRAEKVRLESNTELIGRKCDNPTCLAREGLGGAIFKRCGACKSVFYCSQHCQRTHWRDEHAKACKEMAAKAVAS